MVKLNIWCSACELLALDDAEECACCGGELGPMPKSDFEVYSEENPR